MCGILAILSDNVDDDTLRHLLRSIARRGPDYESDIFEKHSRNGLRISFAASLLHLRGDQLQIQPVIDDCGNILLFNGQIYEFDGSPIQPSNRSDTAFLSERLNMCKTREDIPKTLSLIDGPFAIIYWNHSLQCLFYGRDLFGRKSLCVMHDGQGKLSVISSTAMNKNSNNDQTFWSEVDCFGFHCLDYACETMEQKVFAWNIDLVYPPSSKCNVNREPLMRLEGNVRLDPSKVLSSLNRVLKQSSEFTDEDWSKALTQLEIHLMEAVKKRIKYNNPKCLECRRQNLTANCKHSKILVAFSGGIDSTLLALIVDKVYDKSETIDLSTVAFKDNSPDRESVASAFSELRKLSPDRQWQLIINDVSIEELQRQRQSIIRHLTCPCNTVVDDSLACACWFIGKASGRAMSSKMDNDQDFERAFEQFVKFNINNVNDQLTSLNLGVIKMNYSSPATMIFAGSSLDEQLGGYSSHRAAYSRAKIEGLYDEICFQMRRLSTRNLARDDRVYSDHGRDLKLPYLDFSLVSFLNSLPIGLKMDLRPEAELELGPKKLLRLLAMRFGLHQTATRVKRAMQFGTRIANLEGKGEKGHQICSRVTGDSLG